MSNRQTDVANPDLVAAIEVFFKDPGKTNEERIRQEIKRARFLLPIESADAEELSSDAMAQRALVRIEEGDSLAYVAFTDVKTLRAWRPGAEEDPLVLTFAQLADLNLRAGEETDGFVLNPGTHHLPVSRDALAQITGQFETYTVGKKAEVRLSSPKPFPRALAGAISKAVKKRKEVNKVWLMKMTRNGEESFLAVIDFSGDRETIIEAIGQAVRPWLQSGEFLDIVSSSGRFGRSAIKGQKPIFKRGLFG